MDKSNKIAVIGMACRFPGAKNIDEYWNNLIQGRETIKRFTDDELRPFEINLNELKKDPNYVPARGVINNVEDFDASFFDFTPNEASLTDPQHRVWLETSWEAFENAGCDPFLHQGSIGVFAGGYMNTYLLNNILRDQYKLENYIRLRTAESFQLMTTNDITYLPTKTAYKFNLKGPAINVQTACSTSLVAITQACQSLSNKESDVCIAGGVCIMTPQETGYIHQEGSIPSPDGHCRPFDANAEGTVFSNGVGAVILKRLEDAISENDNIIAVVDGWALNNDGNKKLSFTAPSIEGQTDVILEAQKRAGISADEVGYIETHGTGTLLGDPIEITALTNAFDNTTNKKQFCGVGSVKSNIGHTDAAAGVASFIKLCLIAKNRKIPPTINYKTPNPHINFEHTPFFVVDKITEYDKNKKIIMGVSSFGIGGTNAHVIVEEAPQIKQKNNIEHQPNGYIIPLSAKSKESLAVRKKQLIEFVQKNPNVDIDDLAYTLWHGRNHMKYRTTTVVSNVSELLDKDIQFSDGVVDERTTCLAFMFPGQGSQYYQMGKGLYEENEVFRTIVNKGFSIFQSETGYNLKDILFDSDDVDESEKTLAETAFTQPALFVIQYALAKTLTSNGIKPIYLIGHSIGEYAAACLAGVFDFEVALKIVIKRGQLMQQMKPGSMVVVRCTAEQLEKINNEVLEIAAQNGPRTFTISFESQNKTKVLEILEKNEIDFLPINTSHAFHSKAFEPILEEFTNYVNTFELKSPEILTVSCLTGDFLTAEQTKSGKYWAQQLRNTVQFYSGIKSITDQEQPLFIEIGANSHLSSILQTIPEVETRKQTILSLGRQESKIFKLIIEKIVGNIWSKLDIFRPDLNYLSTESKKIELPVYPFKRERYWISYKPDSKVMEKVTDSEILEQKVTLNKDYSTIEDKLLEIWKDSIGVDDIKINDNFFYVGGTSLLAIDIVDKAKRMFDVELSLKAFFDTPTINDFAQHIKSTKKNIKTPSTKNKKVFTKIISGEL